MELSEQDIQNSLQVLQTGGVVLFPADYGWSLGCDATNNAAVRHLRQLVQKPDGHLPVLLSEERDVLQWVAAADLAVFDFVAEQTQPTAIVFEFELGFAENLLSNDGTVLILLTQHPFCRHLVKRFRSPIVAVPCNSEEVKRLQQSSISFFAHQDAASNLTSPQSLASTLQIVYWNNGHPVVKPFL